MKGFILKMRFDCPGKYKRPYLPIGNFSFYNIVHHFCRINDTVFQYQQTVQFSYQNQLAKMWLIYA